MLLQLGPRLHSRLARSSQEKEKEKMSLVGLQRIKVGAGCGWPLGVGSLVEATLSLLQYSRIPGARARRARGTSRVSLYRPELEAAPIGQVWGQAVTCQAPLTGHPVSQ